MSNLFKYLLKKRVLSLVFTTVILGIVFYWYNNLSQVISRIIDNIGSKGTDPSTTNTVDYYFNTAFLIYTVGICALTYIIPVFEFSFKMKKRNVDQLYSLPIKRWKFFLTKYLFGLFEVLVPFSIAYGISALLIIPVIPNSNITNPMFILYYYLCIVGLGALLYSFNTFIFTRQNTVIDGVIMLTISSFLSIEVAFAVGAFLPSMKYDGITEFGLAVSPIGPMDIMTAKFQSILVARAVDIVKPITTVQLVAIIIAIIIGIASVFGVLFLNPRDKSENANQKSDSWFGYRVVIPVLALSMASTINSSVGLVLSLALTYLFYVIYQRTFKLNKKTIIVCCSVIAAEIIFFLLVSIIQNQNIINTING